MERIRDEVGCGVWSQLPLATQVVVRIWIFTLKRMKSSWNFLSSEIIQLELCFNKNFLLLS
jgi:hypothetical protein